MNITVFENGPFLVNTYLVVNDGKKGFIIDPGSELHSLFDKVEQEDIELHAIVNTHGHIDHVAGVNTVKKKYNIPFYMNELDLPLLDSLQVQARMFGVPDPGYITIDNALPNSGEITIAGMEIKVLYTPGHSKGSVSLLIENAIFTGDVLFNFSIGRTDLPGGNYGELIRSVKEKIFVLPHETIVLPGHGPQTTVEREKRYNPFFN